MTRPEVEPNLDRWARLVGFLYVATNLTSIVGFYARSRAMAPGGAAAGVEAMLHSELLFRIGMVAELVTIAGVLLLVVGLFLILEPVGRGLAIAATFWRLTENIVAATLPLASVSALTIAGSGGAAGQPFAHALFPGVYGFGWHIVFFFLGLGSTLFSCLWLKSRYIPGAIALWGIFSSLVLVVFSSLLMVEPDLARTFGMAYLMPMGLYEFGLGIWLMAVGLKQGVVIQQPA